jgi:pyruvate ferredoxin oxidoreductase alpha subunit
MGTRVGMEASIAVAEAVALCDADVVAAYPITPQTHIVEHLAELVADGELDAEFIPVESEHSAMSCCVGSAAAGARTFTATSSQGLALMHEILYIASALRMPIVMSVVDRALSGPISIWNDHADIMAQRDTGWIQTFAENAQEAVDMTLHAFRVAEDPAVCLPVMYNLDGFILSHMIEPVVMPDHAEVERYLPTFKPAQRLDVDHPISMGPVGIPPIYTEAKHALQNAITGALPVIEKAWDEMAEVFGRRYHPIETYRTDGAEVALVTMGSIGETAMTYVDQARESGVPVGLVRVRLWRPFPQAAFLDAVKGVKALAVIDRCPSPGSVSGPVAAELKGLLYGRSQQPRVVEFQVGLGGRDVPVQDFDRMVQSTLAVLAGRPLPPPRFLQVRE